jgi:hypothetical protein
MFVVRLQLLLNLFDLMLCKLLQVLFSSAGDAAMAQKTFRDANWQLADSVRFASLSAASVTADDDAVVIVKPVNSVGDPVILDVSIYGGNNRNTYTVNAQMH